MDISQVWRSSFPYVWSFCKYLSAGNMHKNSVRARRVQMQLVNWRAGFGVLVGSSFSLDFTFGGWDPGHWVMCSAAAGTNKAEEKPPCLVYDAFGHLFLCLPFFFPSFCLKLVFVFLHNSAGFFGSWWLLRVLKGFSSESIHPVGLLSSWCPVNWWIWEWSQLLSLIDLSLIDVPLFASFCWPSHEVCVCPPPANGSMLHPVLKWSRGIPFPSEVLLHFSECNSNSEQQLLPLRST